MPIAFEAALELPDGSAITFAAQRGTQTIGHATGNPLDCTTPGDVTVTVHAPGDGRTITINPDYFGVFIETARAAFNAADTRDRTADKVRERVGA